ncbi:hypothetical protein SLNSH_14625 [Alsobacter soli]|uniref:SGNH hydrolase-type esterase domain-containing protein n=1 Tax=Alsobacter soli TaxID=2109933 RepID=A0A2T1HRF3_9HYPH|nr:SGNH/GDSL hydrolase family protein [Alsobacter soli]PSC04225.1 hypothetical protein SLNSH_14625 [Alsobacter soli]
MVATAAVTTAPKPASTTSDPKTVKPSTPAPAPAPTPPAKTVELNNLPPGAKVEIIENGKTVKTLAVNAKGVLPAIALTKAKTKIVVSFSGGSLTVDVDKDAKGNPVLRASLYDEATKTTKPIDTLDLNLDDSKPAAQREGRGYPIQKLQFKTFLVGASKLALRMPDAVAYPPHALILRGFTPGQAMTVEVDGKEAYVEYDATTKRYIVRPNRDGKASPIKSLTADSDGQITIVGGVGMKIRLNGQANGKFFRVEIPSLGNLDKDDLPAHFLVGKSPDFKPQDSYGVIQAVGAKGTVSQSGNAQYYRGGPDADKKLYMSQLALLVPKEVAKKSVTPASRPKPTQSSTPSVKPASDVTLAKPYVFEVNDLASGQEFTLTLGGKAFSLEGKNGVYKVTSLSTGSTSAKVVASASGSLSITGAEGMPLKLTGATTKVNTITIETQHLGARNAEGLLDVSLTFGTSGTQTVKSATSSQADAKNHTVATSWFETDPKAPQKGALRMKKGIWATTPVKPTPKPAAPGLAQAFVLNGQNPHQNLTLSLGGQSFTIALENPKVPGVYKVTPVAGTGGVTTATVTASSAGQTILKGVKGMPVHLTGTVAQSGELKIDIAKLGDAAAGQPTVRLAGTTNGATVWSGTGTLQMPELAIRLTKPSAPPKITPAAGAAGTREIELNHLPPNKDISIEIDGVPYYKSIGPDGKPVPHRTNSYGSVTFAAPLGKPVLVTMKDVTAYGGPVAITGKQLNIEFTNKFRGGRAIVWVSDQDAPESHKTQYPTSGASSGLPLPGAAQEYDTATKLALRMPSEIAGPSATTVTASQTKSAATGSKGAPHLVQVRGLPPGTPVTVTITPWSEVGKALPKVVTKKVSVDPVGHLLVDAHVGDKVLIEGFQPAEYSILIRSVGGQHTLGESNSYSGDGVPIVTLKNITYGAKKAEEREGGVNIKGLSRVYYGATSIRGPVPETAFHVPKEIFDDKDHPDTDQGAPMDTAPVSSAFVVPAGYQLVEINDLPPNAPFLVTATDDRGNSVPVVAAGAKNKSLKTDAVGQLVFACPIGSTVSVTGKSVSSSLTISISKLGTPGEKRSVTLGTNQQYPESSKAYPTPVPGQFQSYHGSEGALKTPKTAIRMPAGFGYTPHGLLLTGLGAGGVVQFTQGGRTHSAKADDKGQLSLTLRAGDDVVISYTQPKGGSVRLTISKLGVAGEKLASPVAQRLSRITADQSGYGYAVTKLEVPSSASTTFQPYLFQGYRDASGYFHLPSKLPAPANTIGVVGDSLSDQQFYWDDAGGSAPPRTWATQLRDRSLPLLVSGVHGASVTGTQRDPQEQAKYLKYGWDVKTRLKNMIDTGVKTIVLAVGANDARFNVDPAKFIAAYKQLIDMVPPDVKLVICGFKFPSNYGGPNRDAIASAYEDIAAYMFKRKKAPGSPPDIFVKNLFDGMLDAQGHIAAAYRKGTDAIHPSEAGQGHMADIMFDILAPASAAKGLRVSTSGAGNGGAAAITASQWATITQAPGDAKSPLMSKTMAQAILSKVGDVPVDPTPSTKSHDNYIGALRLIARAALGELTDIEKKTLGKSTAMATALRWAGQIDKLARKLDYGDGIAIIRKNQSSTYDTAARLETTKARGIERAWLVYLHEPGLVDKVLQSPTTYSELAPDLAGVLTDAQAKTIIDEATAAHRTLKLEASNNEDPLSHTLLLLAYVHTKKAVPAAVTSLDSTRIYQNAQSIVVQAKAMATQFAAGQTGLQVLGMLAPAFGQGLKAKLDQESSTPVSDLSLSKSKVALEGAFDILMKDRRAFAMISAITNRAPLDVRYDGDYLPVKIQEGTLTVSQLIATIDASPEILPGQPITKDALRAIVRAVASLAHATTNVDAKHMVVDFKLTKTLLDKALQNGNPGAAVIKAMLGTFMPNQEPTVSQLLQHFLSPITINLQPTQGVVASPYEGVLLPFHALQQLQKDWSQIKHSGDRVSNEELYSFIESRKSTSNYYQFLSANPIFQKMIFWSKKKDASGTHLTKLLNAMEQRINKELYGTFKGKTLMPQSTTRDGALAVWIYSPFFSVPGPTTSDKWIDTWDDDIKVYETLSKQNIDEFLAGSTSLPIGMKETMLELEDLGTMVGQVADTGLPGNRSGDGKYTVGNIRLALYSRIVDSSTLPAGKKKSSTETDGSGQGASETLTPEQTRAAMAKTLLPQIPTPLATALSNLYPKLWDALADESLKQDDARELQVLKQAVQGVFPDPTTQHDDCVHLARVMRNLMSGIGMAEAGKSKVIRGFDLKVFTKKGTGDEAGEIAKNALEGILGQQNYSQWLMQSIIPKMRSEVVKVPGLEDQIMTYASSLVSLESVKALRDHVAKTKQGQPDMDQVKEGILAQLASLLPGLSPEKVDALMTELATNMTLATQPDIQKDIQTLVDLYGKLPEDDASYRAVGKTLLEQLGIKLTPKFPMDKLGIFAQRAVRALSSTLRFQNTIQDRDDEVMKAVLTALDDIMGKNDGKWIVPESTEGACYLKAANGEWVRVDQLPLEDAKKAYKQQTGLEFKATTQKELVAEVTKAYRGEFGTTMKMKVRQMTFAFKVGAVHITSFLVGTVLTAIAMRMNPGKQWDDKVKYGLGFVIAGMGLGVGLTKAGFNLRLLSAASSDIVKSLADLTKVEKDLKTFGSWGAIGTQLDKVESVCRMISGSLYVGYGAVSIYSVMSGKYFNYDLQLVDGLVNFLGGVLPFFEGMAQWGKWKVAAVGVEALGTTFKSRAFQLGAKLYSMKMPFTFSGMAFGMGAAITSAAILGYALAAYSSQETKKNKAKAYFKKVMNAHLGKYWGNLDYWQAQDREQIGYTV